MRRVAPRALLAAGGLLLAGRLGAQARAAAPVDASAFQYARAIPPGESGLVAIRLDAAVLAHSSRSDLRIATDDGRQVPYLLDHLDEPLVVTLPALQRISGATSIEQLGGTAPRGRTRYRIILPFAGLPEGELVLNTTARVFDRRVSLAMEEPPVGSDEPRRPAGERVIGSAEWRNANPDSAAHPLSFTLPPLRVSELVLVVDEGDNPALPISPPKLLLPSYRLRFFRAAGTPLTLLYGQQGLEPPRYDLALIAARVGEPVRDVALGPERIAPHVARNTPLVVFWSALVIAVTVLLALLARLLRQGSSSADAPPAPSAGPPPPPD